MRWWAASSPPYGWLGWRGGVLALALGLCGCGGIDFGDNPRRDVQKETGPLTVPPPDVQKGLGN
jgi:hypothetical protein